jgi:hypothetical protein
VTLLFVLFLGAWLFLRRPLKKQAENGDTEITPTSQEKAEAKAEGEG